MIGRRSRRLPTREELELWALVTRQDRRLARDEAPMPDLTSPQGESGRLNGKPAPAKPCGSQSQPERVKRNGNGRVSEARAPHAPPVAHFNARLARLIARGQQPIDARLDLHGLRQHDAYFALRRFLSLCQSSGHRHVLIITGKGDKVSGAGERDFWSMEQRGVLRRLVPQWLSEPEFRSMVVSFTESGLRHGGSGALYVTIRRLRRTAGR